MAVRRVKDLRRIRVIVDEETSQTFRTMEELFVDAAKDQWSSWFKTEPSDIDDMCTPVISINRKGEHVATIMAEGEWDKDEAEVSCRLTGAVFDHEGFTLIWKLVSLKPEPEPEPEHEPEPEPEPEPEAEQDPVPQKPQKKATLDRKALKEREIRAIERRARKQIAAIMEDMDSD